jgi:hypothetical protein
VGHIQPSIQDWVASVLPQPSRGSAMPTRLKQLTGRAAFGAALLMTCLQAGTASALSFNFSFSGTGGNNTPNPSATVTGIVSGLVDNTLDQQFGLTFAILSATNNPIGGWSPFDAYVAGNGFDVSGGLVTGVDILYSNNDSAALALGNHGFITPELASSDLSFVNTTNDSTSSNGLSFAPTSPASVPGPLPLFGARAAFAWSRRLRRRFKSPA